MTRFATQHMRYKAGELGAKGGELGPKAGVLRSRATHNHGAPKDPTAVLGVLGIVFLTAVLVPLVLISAYNHSYADDWHYGVWAHLALEDGANFFQIIWVALQQAGKAWFEWQGTYSAIFLMALEPSVWGEQFYVLGAPLVLTTLVAGTFFFGHVMLCELMDAPRGLWLALCSLVVGVQLLLQPSPVEGIFWYNSAVYYTTYNAAALAMLGCLGRICNPERKKRPRGVMVSYCLLAAFIAGGNFVTALVLFEIMVVVIALLWRSQRRCTFEALVGFVILLLGLVISFVAPGNSVRQATQFPEDNAGVWGTIWGSSLACFQYIQEWSTGLVWLVVIAAIGVALYVCPRALERGLRFRYPALVAVGSVALFATSFTPTFWAESSVGPGRVQNCRFDFFVLLLVVNVFWLVGWLEQQRQQLQADSPAGGHLPALISVRHVCTWIGICMLVVACTIGTMATVEDRGEDLSSISAARSLISGKAEAYHEQVLERLDYIESSTESELEVVFYHDIPHVLWMGDIRDNMDNYINYRLCQWYGKDSIIGVSSTAASAVGVSNE